MTRTSLGSPDPDDWRSWDQELESNAEAQGMDVQNRRSDESLATEAAALIDEARALESLAERDNEDD
jgi:hypothetical protein